MTAAQRARGLPETGAHRLHLGPRRHRRWTQKTSLHRGQGAGRVRVDTNLTGTTGKAV